MIQEIELGEFLTGIIQTTKSSAELSDLIDFLEAHDWFDYRPDFSQGKVLLIDEQIELYEKPLIDYLTSTRSSESLIKTFADKYPVTADYLDKFFDEECISEEDRYFLLDFMLLHLHKEITACKDNDADILVNEVSKELSKTRGYIFIDFLDWCRSYKIVAYTNTYKLGSRAPENKEAKEAYDMGAYLQLIYYLFNKDYIEQNDMYRKSAESKNHVDTWLFMTLHFVCALRLTDLRRIYHPTLSMPPQAVLDSIKDGTWTDADGIKTLHSILDKFSILPLTPNKTSRYNNIDYIKFFVPTSCEAHLGALFAIAEAHHQLAEISSEEPLVRKISSYQEITRYMGSEIGDLFLYRDFSSRSANKSYLQAICMLSDEILDDSTAFRGYYLASYARSHKGRREDFLSDVTATYLKDGKFTGMNTANIAYQYLDRGVLSSITSYLFKLMPGLGFDSMSATQQTEIFKVFDMIPYEAERTIDVVARSREQARELAQSIINDESEETIIKAIERIVMGQAYAKRDDCYCLLTALGKPCGYPQATNCLGCEYEILTKATLFYLTSEYKRMLELYKQAETTKDKDKWQIMATNIILPRIQEMLICLKEDYSEELFNTYKTLLEDMLNE